MVLDGNRGRAGRREWPTGGRLEEDSVREVSRYDSGFETRRFSSRCEMSRFGSKGETERFGSRDEQVREVT